MGAINQLEAQRQKMVRLFTQLAPREGAWPAPVDGVVLLKNSASYPPVPAFYEPCIVLVAQGLKRFHFPDAVLTYDAHHYMMVTVPVPANCEALVADEGPFLGLAVRINLQVLADTLLHIGPLPSPAKYGDLPLTISAPAMDARMAACGVRLLRAMLSPIEAAVLGPLLIRELHFRALTGPAGGMLRALLNGSAGRRQVHRVLERMHAEYSTSFRVEESAHEAGMSVSAFHEHFRAVTGSSPLVYLKQLRLHRARTMMVQSELSAAEAAEQVGYTSQSQFSREYKRMFGFPPVQESRRLRMTLGL